jgi:hypothetical protein
MNKILFALIFAVIGFLLAYLIHFITMRYDKVSENTKLNRDMVVGALAGITTNVVMDPSYNNPHPIKNVDGTVLGKCVYDELRASFSEKQISNFVYDFIKFPQQLTTEDKNVATELNKVLPICITKHNFS